MKNKILKILPLCMILLFFSGCSSGSFFDIAYFYAQNTRLLHNVNKEQKNVLYCAKEYCAKTYMNSNIKLQYAQCSDGYRRFCIITDFKNPDLEGDDFALLFCEVSAEPKCVHVLFLKKSKGSWNVFEDLEYAAWHMDQVYIKDIDNDGNNEFAFVVGNIDRKSYSTYMYRYQGGNVLEMDVYVPLYSFYDEDYED